MLSLGAGKYSEDLKTNNLNKRLFGVNLIVQSLQKCCSTPRLRKISIVK